MSVQEMIQEARQLSPAERKELMRALVEMLPDGDAPAPKKRSILELRGLGAEIWEGIDAQEYVRQIRSEWDHRP
jgi:hypothetical protein